MSKLKINGIAAEASDRPWRIAHVSKLSGAVIMGADNAVVAVCNADNAELIVEAVNAKWEMER